MRGICTKKIGAISQLGADRRTDICFYRVALLLIKMIFREERGVKLMAVIGDFGLATRIPKKDSPRLPQVNIIKAKSGYK